MKNYPEGLANRCRPSAFRTGAALLILAAVTHLPASADDDLTKRKEKERIDLLLRRAAPYNKPDLIDKPNLIDQVTQQLKKCWRLPNDAKSLVVTVTWRMNPDGTVRGEPEVKNGSKGADADAAVRAIKACSPFRLDRSRFKEWETVTFQFDPRSVSR